MQALWKRYATIVTILICLFASTAEARKKAATYIDENGIERVQKTGKIYRDYKAINEFKKNNPKPDDGHAYDIDHKKALKDGGKDTPSNMQWVRTEDHRKKTAREAKRRKKDN